MIQAIPEVDICVIGTGPAAFALLAGLQRRNCQHSILFVEGASGLCPPFVLPNTEPHNLSGSRRSKEYFTDTQDFYKGKLSGWIASTKPDYLQESRVRVFGGTGTALTGWFCPFLPELHATDAFQTWPLEYQELAFHYRLVLETLGLPANILSADVFRDSANLPKWPEEKLRKDDWYSTFSLLFPFDFRHAFLQALEMNHKAQLLCAKSAVHLETANSKQNNRVTECLLRNSVAGMDLKEIPVHASVYVIAMGALETTRLLLASGLSKQLPALGKCFTEHPYLWNGGRIETMSMNKNLDFYFKPSLFQLTSRIGVLHFISRLPKANIHHLPIRFATNGLNQPPVSLNVSWETKATQASLNLVWSQTDRIGMPMLQLNSGDTQKALQIDRLSAAVDDYIRLIADLLGIHRAYLAPFAKPLTDWEAPYRITPGNHPAGTCRMAQTSMEGVVDNQCRVHNFDNLYIASSATFPASGYANPTLTVMALADRLAQHLS